MTRPPPRTLDVHVLAHTHWDREWYHTAPHFRLRLIALVEQLLAGGATPNAPFLLDGQAVVLEDVASARPDLRDRLASALQTGAIDAGPWYVLADELIPSAEMLVRNLLAGRQVLRSFGAESPRVCYSPDAFGHTHALPTIASGFGLEVAVLWRGYGGVRWPHGDTVRWRAPDGSTLLVWHLPTDGYEFGRDLPVAADEVGARWRLIRDTLAERALTGVVLLMNGADHHALQPDVHEAMEALRREAAADGHSVKRSSLSSWSNAVREAVSTANVAPDIPEITGELRDSYGSVWTLQGTFATRAWQKRAVARTGAELVNDVEPWIALAIMKATATTAHASDMAEVRAMHRALLRTWRTFLRTLPHDTLCGCSVDAVARALDHRLAVVRVEAAALRELAINSLLSRNAVEARKTARDAWYPRLVLRNRSARVRYGVAEVELVHTLQDVPVGPGSYRAESERAEEAPLMRPDGLVTQALRTVRRFARRESPQHYPDNDLVQATRALVWLPPSASMGGFSLQTVPLVHDANASEPRKTPVVTLERSGSTAVLHNGRLRLDITPHGISLRDHLHERTIDDLVRITWQADHGDTYTAAPRGPLHHLRLIRARIVARGPLRAIVAVTYAARLPHNAVNADAPDQRAARYVRTRVTVRYILDAGAAHVRLDISAHNRAGDHRLRISLATGVSKPRIIADAAFGPVVRVPLDRTTVDERHEHVVTAAPLHRWVTADGGDVGTTICSDGLAEYEDLPDARIAISLLRVTGELSRASLPERPGHAGWPAPVPAAQGRRRLRARIAIAPHGAFDAEAAYETSEDVLSPLIGYTWRDAPPDAPEIVPGVTLTSAGGIIASTVKPADDGRGIILRSVNVDNSPRDATWLLPWSDVHVSAARLDETTAANAERVALVHYPVGSAVHQHHAPREVPSVRVDRD